MEYGVYSEFNVKKHKETFKHYLEVIIDENGKVMYAVPSHTEKLIRIAAVKYNTDRDGINNMCPPEYYFDFLIWLLMITNCVSVWTNFYRAAELNEKQLNTLIKLKNAGIYEGTI